jgi:predicted nucleotidyltransferase
METMNENEITQAIKEKLTQIEQRENIRILYACESGSRAWGFASPDSDYDVRFIFVRPVEDYLRVKELPDYIDAELNDVYDINGWDLKKFFKQLYKSNPVIFEWANSPIVYRTTSEWEHVKANMQDFVLQVAMIHHYRGMAKSNVRSNFSTTEVVLKKYLYVLRPVLACVWIMQKYTVPPTEFSKLVGEVLPDELKPSVNELLEVKMKSSEKNKGSRIPQIDSFIEAKLNEATMFPVVDEEQENYEKLDKLFLEIVRQGA